MTTVVLEQLNARSGFRVRSYIAEGEDPHLTRTTLIENLETLIDAVLTLLSLGIESEDGTTRLEILRQRFRNGTDVIRDHCRQHRGKMQDPGTFKMMVDMVDDDLGRWSSALLTRALAFQKQHQKPPEIEFMPPVIGPQWTVIGITSRAEDCATLPLAAPTPSNLQRSALGWKHLGQPVITSAFWTTDREVATTETARGRTPRNPTAAPATGAAAREADAETAEVPLVAIQAGAAAGAAATASPTVEAAAGAAIAGPVIAAGVPLAPRDTGSATRQGQPRSTRSTRLR